MDLREIAVAGGAILAAGERAAWPMLQLHGQQCGFTRGLPRVLRWPSWLGHRRTPRRKTARGGRRGATCPQNK
ncbi:hypothetical protein FBZ93_1154 [Bradyrhizobium macuxiense]|uniref:Uncharacterized protein n=1 Tax=Bradyrhizobium macuxiense TaxID=1755647 RepID=A0A560L3L1_9BRAD|nr:hypothetical protein FBZ93_1154 [Bradyrhizobium macuxiense]